MALEVTHVGRTKRSGPRVRRTRAVFAAVSGVVLMACLTGCGTSHAATQPPLGFRSPPAFLPKTTEPVDRVVTASATHPQLAVQGIAVKVDLPGGHVLAKVSGPNVPPFVAPPPPAVTATFDISLSQASGRIPIRLRDFTITDQLGRTFRTSLVAGEKPPPAVVSPGRTVAFRVTAVMPTGEGRLHWSPTRGAPVVSWDFIVEND